MSEPTQPALQPTFDSSLTNAAQPDSPHQANGWGANEIPSSSNFNWLFATLALWVAYVKNLLAYWIGANSNEVLTITAGAVVPTQANSTFQAAGGTVSNATPTNFKTGRIWVVIGNGTNPTTLTHQAGGSGQFNLAQGSPVSLSAVTDVIAFQFDGTSWNEVWRSTSIIINSFDFNARLSADSSLAVPAADKTAVETLYLQPYGGSRIGLYTGSGSGWNAYNLASPISLAVPASTSQMYDVFVYLSGSTLTLEAVAWTNDTTRATALTTQNGIYVKNGAPTHRYVGSFRTTTVSGKTEDSAAKRYVWNYYNRIRRQLYVADSNVTTYTWNTNSLWRQAAANAANQVEVVCGLAEDDLCVNSFGGFASFTAIGINAVVTSGVGVDSTTVNSAVSMPICSTASGSTSGCPHASYSGQALAGYHTYSRLERMDNGGATVSFQRYLIGDGVTPSAAISGTIKA